MSAHLTILQPTMKTRHIIAIGLLSATAIGILAIGIKTNKNKKEKPLQTNAYTTFDNIENANNRDSLFTIRGSNTAEYTQADATNYYKFNYTWEFTITRDTATHINGYIRLADLKSDQANPLIDVTNTINEDLTDPRADIRGIEITNLGFKVENSYYLTTATFTRFYYYNQTGPQRRLDIQNEFTKTLTDPFTNILNTQPIQIEDFSIYNNLFAIKEYADTQYTNGYNEGVENTIEQVQTSYTNGYTDGKQAGYSEGWNNSDAFNHPIALQPLMLQILSMPFTFISKAFDVTLWPNTQYEFNIANFIKGLIAIATIMFIIKLFTSGFAIIGNYTGRVQNHKLTKSQIEYNKAKSDLAKRTDPNHKTQTSTSHNTNINVNKKG